VAENQGVINDVHEHHEFVDFAVISNDCYACFASALPIVN